MVDVDSGWMFGWVWTACGYVALECEMKIGGLVTGSETGTRIESEIGIENEIMIKRTDGSESENGIVNGSANKNRERNPD
jgi:hypothetical protein